MIYLKKKWYACHLRHASTRFSPILFFNWEFYILQNIWSMNFGGSAEKRNKTGKFSRKWEWCRPQWVAGYLIRETLRDCWQHRMRPCSCRTTHCKPCNVWASFSCIRRYSHLFNHPFWAEKSLFHHTCACNIVWKYSFARTKKEVKRLKKCHTIKVWNSNGLAQHTGCGITNIPPIQAVYRTDAMQCGTKKT